MICARCGSDNPDHARFCLACGVAFEAWRREARKTVTVVFCDLTESTRLGESVDPEALRALLSRYFERMKAIVERHGGTVEKFIGDAVVAVFGVPVLHEDDAVRALRAASEMRAALPELGVQARIGVNSGEVVTAPGGALVMGDAANVAARLEQAAPPGEVYVGAATVALARGQVEAEAVDPLALKGKAKPVRAFRLVGVARVEKPRVFHGAFVGRERECDVLRLAFDLAASSRSCRLLTVVGGAGVGKSRLAAEFLRHVDAFVATGHCLSYGDGITLWPVHEVVQQLRAFDPPAALRGGEVEATSMDEIAFAVRRLFEEVARNRPLVVVWDDVQWGETAFLDLVEGVARAGHDASILMLCLGRPELLDRRPDWGAGLANASTVVLEPLDRVVAEDLLGRLAPDLAPDLRDRIVASAAGNPLFVEEMAAMVAETPPDGDTIVPPTIQALLAARLEQLPDGERVVLEHGAVEGQVFHRSAVEALVPAAGEVAPQLPRLVRKDLVRPDSTLLAGDEAYRFRHILIRDAAYDALPKATRAELHQRFADWLDEHGALLVDVDELVGYHLEQSARYLRDVGGDPVRAAALAGRSAERLAAAGRAALAREDADAASALLQRASELAADSTQPGILAELADAYLEADQFERALDVAKPLLACVDGSVASSARLTELCVRLRTDRDFVAHAGLAELDALVAAAPPEDDLLLGRIWLVHHRLLFNLGRTRESLEPARRSAEHAARCADRRTEARALVSRVAAETHGPTPVAEAIATCRDALERVTQPWSRSVVWQKLALVEAQAGDVAAARGAYRQAKQLAVDYGLRLRRGVQTQEGALVELLGGDAAAAERELREGDAILTSLGDRGFRASVSALLAAALLEQGRDEDAQRAAAHAVGTAQPGDVDVIARARTVEALVGSREGRHDAAREAAVTAVAAAETSDYLELQGYALLGAARVYAAAGDDARAIDAAASALQRYEQKGHIFGAAEARRVLAALSESSTSLVGAEAESDDAVVPSEAEGVR
jgi:class 3 adenylate cyclase/tetratricopeptide (TPR) repeat protein